MDQHSVSEPQLLPVEALPMAAPMPALVAPVAASFALAAVVLFCGGQWAGHGGSVGAAAIAPAAAVDSARSPSVSAPAARPATSLETASAGQPAVLTAAPDSLQDAAPAAGLGAGR
jgi:hypothetical protein